MRWTAGGEPPAAVPEALRADIAEVERTVLVGGGPAPGWTLTWLEGRPIVELDTGVIVTLDGEGAAVVRHDVDDDFA